MQDVDPLGGPQIAIGGSYLNKKWMDMLVECWRVGWVSFVEFGWVLGEMAGVFVR